MYLLSDNYGNFSKVMNLKEIRNFLYEELERDTIENIDNMDIVSNNLKFMKKLFEEKYPIKVIFNELESYGWYAQDLYKLQRDVNNLSGLLEYQNYDNKEEDIKNINKVVDLISTLIERK